MVYGSGTRRTDQHHHKGFSITVSHQLVQWSIYFGFFDSRVACMFFSRLLLLSVFCVGYARVIGCLWVLGLLSHDVWVRVGLLTCGVWVGAYGGTITESINSGLLLYGLGALGMDTIFKSINPLILFSNLFGNPVLHTFSLT